jgi:DNA-directed RNA polymerase subunit RPC12/RpoP
MPKIKASCPGQNPAYLKDFKTNIVPCPRCGHEIEFFSDERKVKCPRCHTNVFKVNPQIIKYKDGKLAFSGEDESCLDWCGGCLNKKDYQDIEENIKRIEKKKEDFKKLINSISKKDKDIIDFFIEAFQKSINNPRLIDERVFHVLQKENPGLFVRARNYYLNFISG